MITGIQVRNLRAIADSGLIRLRRINVLVGRNSAGKSTLLRLLPLLRQSVEQKTKGPILWYGRLVDFGTFENAVRESSSDKTITIEFEAKLDSRRQALRRNTTPTVSGRQRRKASQLPVIVRLVLGNGVHDKVGRVRELTLDFGEDNVLVTFRENGDLNEIILNARKVELRANQQWMIYQGKILPLVHVLKLEELTDTEGEKRQFLAYEDEPFATPLLKSLMMLVHGNTAPGRMRSVTSVLAYSLKIDFFNQLKSLPGLPPSFYQNLASEGPSGYHVSQIRRNALLASLSSILADIDSELESFASSVRYIEPLRATAERYYRLQDLAVDEIDSRGANVAMFLSSLSEFEMEHLTGWMKENLGFHVRVFQGSGHVEVQVVSEEGVANNLADLGFGYSQILPIVLQLWRAMVMPNAGLPTFNSRPIIAVEQPELHLHPQYQALVADTISAVLKDPRGREGLIFAETHSEHFINRLGELISEKRLSPEDVQVLVIEQTPGCDATVTVAEYSAAGFLGEEWPSGFFVPRRRDAVLA